MSFNIPAYQKHMSSGGDRSLRQYSRGPIQYIGADGVPVDPDYAKHPDIGYIPEHHIGNPKYKGCKGADDAYKNVD